MQAFAAVGYAQALGAMRTYDFDPEALPQGISVDTVANTLLAIGWLTATKFRNEKLKVYNLTNTIMTNEDGFKRFTYEARHNPTLAAVRPPADLSKRPSRFVYHYTRWINEWFFILIIEKLLHLAGMKLWVQHAFGAVLMLSFFFRIVI